MVKYYSLWFRFLYHYFVPLFSSPFQAPWLSKIACLREDLQKQCVGHWAVIKICGLSFSCSHSALNLCDCPLQMTFMSLKCGESLSFNDRRQKNKQQYKTKQRKQVRMIALWCRIYKMLLKQKSWTSTKVSYLPTVYDIIGQFLLLFRLL